MESPLNSTFGARMSGFLLTADDYHKLRKRIQKRIIRLRRDLGIIIKDTKNFKQKSEKIDQESLREKEAYKEYLLFLAERDALFASELKSKMEISNDKSSASKDLMNSRLKKAVGTSQRLISISGDIAQIKLLEVYIYAALIQGQLSINKRKWSLATNAFSIAKCGLDLLLAQGKGEQDEQDEETQYSQTLYNDIADTVVDPALNLVASRDEDISDSALDIRTLARRSCSSGSVPFLSPAVEIIRGIDPEYVSDTLDSGNLVKNIVWREHEATIYNDQIAYKIGDLTNRNWKDFSDANQFDELLSEWINVLSLHHTDLDKNKDEDDMEKIQDRAILLTYINYQSNFIKLKRDLLLIDQLSLDQVTPSKSKDINHLYMLLISTIKEIKELPGVYNDEDLLESLESLELYHSAKKSQNIASLYAMNNKFAEALAIIAHLNEQFEKTADPFFKMEDFPYEVASNEQVKQFKVELSESLKKTHIAAQFWKETNQISGKRVIQSIDQYPNANAKGLVPIEIKDALQPILSKPVLFDIAYNYINYPFDAPQPIVTDTASETTKKKGFFGFFGSGK